jgi:hypothetical protein
MFSCDFTGAEQRDFEQTIQLTRDIANLPIVQRHGKPVS